MSSVCGEAAFLDRAGCIAAIFVVALLCFTRSGAPPSRPPQPIVVDNPYLEGLSDRDYAMQRYCEAMRDPCCGAGAEGWVCNYAPYFARSW